MPIAETCLNQPHDNYSVNKKVVKKCNQMLVKQMINHKLLEKAEALWNKWLTSQEWTEHMAKQYEDLNHQFASAVAHADKKCRHIFPDVVHFSQEIRQAIDRNSTVWKGIQKQKKQGDKIN